MNEWIKTSEQLPPMYKRVLICYVSAAQIDVATLEHDHGIDLFNTDSEEIPLKRVQGWMPLPEPPEQKVVDE